MSPRWEYRLVRFPAEGNFRGLNLGKKPDRLEDVEAELNRLGAEGWEVLDLEISGDYNGLVRLRRPVA